MTFEVINIQQLIPSDYNPRIMPESEMIKLSKNLEHFGLVDPIIINLKNMHIIGGHQRYTILNEKYNGNKELHLIKLGDIGWVFENTDLKIKDINHEKALNLSLNSLDGDFNKEELGKILSELKLDADIDMDLTGFKDYEILDYTLDYDMELLKDSEIETTKNDITPQILSSNYTVNINFSTQKQRNKFIELITHLKEKNPQQTIAQSLIQHLTDFDKTQHKKIKEYSILCDTETELQQLHQIHKKLQKKYKQDVLINILDELL